MFDLPDRPEYFGPDHEALRRTVREFIAREVAPHINAWDEAGSFPRELYRKAGAIGLLGIGYPEALGGTPADLFFTIAAAEELAQAGSGGLQASLGSHHIALPPLVALGAEALKQRVVPAVLAGDLLYLSGILPFRDGQVAVTGKLGQEVTVERGAEAARLALLNALAVVKHELGSLDRVQRIVRVVGHVASATGFVQQPAVINGASDLLVQIFGEAGRHARVALGAAELPLHAAIELELLVQVKA